MGMSNYNKNLFVGLGGKDAIDLSHFIGACYGMERMMGRRDNPLRRILNRAADDFLQKLPLVRETAREIGGWIYRQMELNFESRCIFLDR